MLISYLTGDKRYSIIFLRLYSKQSQDFSYSILRGRFT